MLASAVPLPTTRLRCLSFEKGSEDFLHGFRLWQRDVKAHTIRKLECMAGIKMDETSRRSYAMIDTLILTALGKSDHFFASLPA